MSKLASIKRQSKYSTLVVERERQQGFTLPLESYFLKPIQRILKYHLFLQVRLLAENIPNSNFARIFLAGYD